MSKYECDKCNSEPDRGHALIACGERKLCEACITAHWAEVDGRSEPVRDQCTACKTEEDGSRTHFHFCHSCFPIDGSHSERVQDVLSVCAKTYVDESVVSVEAPKPIARDIATENALTDYRHLLPEHTPWANTPNKYKREIRPAVFVDVYDVLKAFGVSDPGTQHAVKKLLCAGERGEKSAQQDLTEALGSIQRAIEMR